MAPETPKRSANDGDDGAAKKAKMVESFSCLCGNKDFVLGYLDFAQRGNGIQILKFPECQEKGAEPSCEYFCHCDLYMFSRILLL